MPLNAVLPAFLVALVGYILGLRFNLDKSTMSKVCIYVLMPALTFNSLSKSTVSLAITWKLGLLTLILPFVLIPVFLLLFRTLKWDKSLSNAMLLPSIFTNAGNYGLPVCLFAFGNEGMDLAVVFMVSQTLVITTAGVYIAASSHMTAKEALTQVVKMPAVYAMLSGILARLSGFTMPEVLARPIDLLSQAAVPVFLLVLGIQLIGTGKDPNWKPPALVIVLRLVVAPALAAIIGQLAGLSGLPWKIFVLEAAMPSPVNATLLAQEFDAKPGQVSMATLGGTVLSVISLSLWIMLLRSF